MTHGRPAQTDRDPAKRALPGAARPDERHPLPAPQREVHVHERVIRATPIAMADVLQPQHDRGIVRRGRRTVRPVRPVRSKPDRGAGRTGHPRGELGGREGKLPPERQSHRDLRRARHGDALGDELGIGEDRTRRSGCAHPATDEHGDPIRERCGNGDAMLGQHDRRAARASDAVEHGEQRDRRGLVQMRGRFVEEEQPGLEGERRGDRDALLLAPGERAERPAVRVAQPDVIERLAHPSRDLGAAEAEALGAERDLIGDPVGDESVERVLEQQGDARRRQVVRRGPGNVVAERHGRPRQIAAAPLGHDALEEPQEGALAAAARTAEEEHLAGPQIQVQVAQRRPVGARVPERQAADPRDAGIGGQRIPARRMARSVR